MAVHLDEKLNNTGEGGFPNLSLLIKIASVIPMSSCSCERSFSTQNRIKTAYRNRFGAETLQALMLVANTDKKIQDFNFGKALSH